MTALQAAAIIALFAFWTALAYVWTPIDISVLLGTLMTLASVALSRNGYGFGIIHEILKK